MKLYRIKNKRTGWYVKSANEHSPSAGDAMTFHTKEFALVYAEPGEEVEGVTMPREKYNAFECTRFVVKKYNAFECTRFVVKKDNVYLRYTGPGDERAPTADIMSATMFFSEEGACNKASSGTGNRVIKLTISWEE